MEYNVVDLNEVFKNHFDEDYHNFDLVVSVLQHHKFNLPAHIRESILFEEFAEKGNNIDRTHPEDIEKGQIIRLDDFPSLILRREEGDRFCDVFESDVSLGTGYTNLTVYYYVEEVGTESLLLLPLTPIYDKRVSVDMSDLRVGVRSLQRRGDHHKKLVGLLNMDHMLSEGVDMEGVPTRIAEIAEDIYPGKVDLRKIEDVGYNEVISNCRGHDGSTHLLIIKFDELEITNSRSDIHKITDLYTIFRINRIGQLKAFYGFRGKLEAKEYNVGYTHSHLSGSMSNACGFCTGSGAFANAKVVLGHDYSEELWEILLTQLKYYLEWESLEGGPFKRISNAIAGEVSKGRGMSDSIIEKNLKRLKDHIPEQVKQCLEASIQNNGDGSSNLVISGWNRIAEWFKKNFEDLDSLEYDDQFLKGFVIYISSDSRQISKMPLDKARRIVRTYPSTNDQEAVEEGFIFQGERITQELFVDESLYQESYETEIIDLNKSIKSFLESRVKANFMDKMSSEININKNTEEYNEHRRQIQTFPERIVASTGVYREPDYYLE